MLRPVFQFIAAAFLLLINGFHIAGAQGVGVTLAMKVSHLPPAGRILRLLHNYHVARIRLYDANPYILNALKHSGILVTVGVLDKDISRLATDPWFASLWVKTNIIPYAQDIKFRCIIVGENLIPDNNTLAPQILPAMQALQKALATANVPVPVTTGFFTNILKTTFPPSAGEFYPEAIPMIKPILDFLKTNGYPLIWDVNSFWWFTSDTSYINIPLEYALLNNTVDVIVQDKTFGYTNLFDGLVDTMYSALEKVGGESIEIVVGETGWPGGDGDIEIDTWEFAQLYTDNLIMRMKEDEGTPRKPDWPVEAYIHTLFFQDAETGDYRNYGMFYTNMTAVYPMPLD